MIAKIRMRVRLDHAKRKLLFCISATFHWILFAKKIVMCDLNRNFCMRIRFSWSIFVCYCCWLAVAELYSLLLLLVWPCILAAVVEVAVDVDVVLLQWFVCLIFDLDGIFFFHWVYVITMCSNSQSMYASFEVHTMCENATIKRRHKYSSCKIV